MAKRREKKSPKRQWSIAGTLIAILLLLILWKTRIIGGGETEEDSVEAAPRPEIQSHSVSIAEFVALIDSAEASRVVVNARLDTSHAILRDPFQVPDLAGIRRDRRNSMTVAGGPDNDQRSDPQREEELRKYRREETLANIVLSGILNTEKWSVAVLNGFYVRKGDSIKGFVVREIRKREVLLHDEDGLVTITLSDPRDNSSLPPRRTQP